MAMSVSFRNRLFQTVMVPTGLMPPYGNIGIPNYTWIAQGGPEESVLEVTGRVSDLWGLMGWLRYAVEIQSSLGVVTWWGYVSSVHISVGSLSVGVSLNSMANAVAVAYVSEDDRYTTEWATESISLGEYGRKELLLPLDEMTEAAAIRIRDMVLAQVKFPLPEYDRGDGPAKAMMECAGWYDTLNWPYYPRDEGLVEYTAGGQIQKLGQGFVSDKLHFWSNRTINDVDGNFGAFNKNDVFRVADGSTYDDTYTVEQGTNIEPKSLVASTIAFLIQGRKTTSEYLRASHDRVRNLNNSNLWDFTTPLTTLSGNVSGGAEEIGVDNVAGIAAGDYIRIALNAGGWHYSIVDGTPKEDTGAVRLETAFGGDGVVADGGNAVERVNRWVTNDGGAVFYTEGSDYTIDAHLGTITVLSTGAIPNNSVIFANYRFSEYRIEDSDLGLGDFNARDVIRVVGGVSNNGYFRVLSSGNEGDQVTVFEPVANEEPGASVTITRGQNIRVEDDVVRRTVAESGTATVWVYGAKLAQSFQIPSAEAWTVAAVQVRARRVGNPADSLRVGIHVTVSGLPAGNPVESASIVATSISGESDWVTWTFANTTSLSPGTTYWIVVDRTGANDPYNYYEVVVDEDLGYADGSFRLHNGSAWVARPVDADMPFRVTGLEPTVTQIEKIIFRKGEFVGSTDVLNTSGLSTNQWRNGDSLAWEELLALLEIGTVNNRRLLCRVTRDRQLRIYEEPAEPSMPLYFLKSDGRVVDRLGNPLGEGDLSFVGQWIGLWDVIPATAALSHIARPAPFMVERAEYSGDEVIIEPRNMDSPWDVGGVTRG